MSTDTSTLAAKYLTLAGATVNITVRILSEDEDGQPWADIHHHAACTATGCDSKTDLYGDRATADTEQTRQAAVDLTSPNGEEIKQWAQSHAATCRAMPLDGAK